MHVDIPGTYSSFLSDLNLTLILSTEFRDCFEYEISRKSVVEGELVVPCGLTGRHDEASNRISQYCEYS
jgi:hypothetical protein